MIDPQGIEPYEIVQMGTGKRIVPPYMDTSFYGGIIAVLQEGLKKDGTPSMATSAGRLYVKSPGERRVNLSDYVRYNAATEALAEPIRDEVKRLHAAIDEAQARLIAVYTEGAQEEGMVKP